MSRHPQLRLALSRQSSILEEEPLGWTVACEKWKNTWSTCTWTSLNTVWEGYRQTCVVRRAGLVWASVFQLCSFGRSHARRCDATSPHKEECKLNTWKCINFMDIVRNQSEGDAKVIHDLMTWGWHEAKAKMTQRRRWREDEGDAKAKVTRKRKVARRRKWREGEGDAKTKVTRRQKWREEKGGAKAKVTRRRRWRED